MREDHQPSEPPANRAHHTADVHLDGSHAPAAAVLPPDRALRSSGETGRGMSGAEVIDRPATSPLGREASGAARERGGENGIADVPLDAEDRIGRAGNGSEDVTTKRESSRREASGPRAAGADRSAPNGAPATARPAADLRLAGCVLLAGGLKPSHLTAASRSSVLDLLVGPSETLLDHWVGLMAPLLRRSENAAVRVIHCEATPAPARPSGSAAVPVSIHVDRDHFRGPAGVARDTCRDLHADDHVLIAEGARFLHTGLSDLVAAHAVSEADITVAANADGSPAGLYLARCEMLELVPGRGFMDLKEQWLSRALERGKRVRVFALPGQGALPLRTLAQFLRACFSAGRGAHVSPWLARGVTRGVLVRGRVTNIISDRAEIDPGALIAHSIAMPGARVAAGALVARSILCPGARVGPGEEVVDSVVTAQGVQSDVEGFPRGSKERTR